MRGRVLAATAMAALGLGASAQATSERNFATHLTGAGEVPARDTPAHGQAKLELARDGDSLLCKLNVDDIENVVAAHIHVGPPEANGPVVAFLYGNEPPGGGPLEGRIATRTVTAADLRGPLTGMSMDDLMEEIRSGNAYVNVHTNDGVGEINTGPGDFPGGEIRGQVD